MCGNGREVLLLRLLLWLLLLLALQLLVQVVLASVHDSTWVPPLYARRWRGRCTGYTSSARSRARGTQSIIVTAPHAGADRRRRRDRVRLRARGRWVLKAGGHLVGEELLGRSRGTPDDILVMLLLLLRG